MTTPIKINTNGSYTVKREPELCDVQVAVRSSGPDAAQAFADVTTTAAQVADVLKPLAGPQVKSESQDQDIDVERRDAAYPVSAWKMQDVRTWSREAGDDDRPPPPPRVLMATAAAAAAPEQPTRTYYAQVQVTATFHDFKEMQKLVAQFAQTQHCEIANLNWRVTQATRAQLQTRVLQGAYKNALTTAQDLAAVISKNTPRPTVVSCHNNTGNVMYSSFGAGARYKSAQHESEPVVDFEPEPISISGDVNVEWVVDP